MPITEALMRPGAFQIRLAEETPQDLRRTFDLLDHVVVTRSRVNPRVIGTTATLAQSLYTGVIRRFTNSRRSLEGAGLLVWWGDDSGKGQVRETMLQSFAGGGGIGTGTFEQWVDAITAATGGHPQHLKPVTIDATGISGTFRWRYSLLCHRFALDRVCRHFDAEYRVYPSGAVKFGKPANIFDWNAPVVVTHDADGSDPLNTGLVVNDLSLEETIEPWSSQVIVLGQGMGGDVAPHGPYRGVANVSPNPYKNLFGDSAVIKRVIDAGEEYTLAEANAAAIIGLSRIGDIRPVVRLSTDTYAIPRHIVPGDKLKVFDPSAGFFDATAGETRFRGHVLHCKLVRVYAYTWPVQRGMGVYLKRGNDGGFTDLTDYVVFEEGATTYEVGERLHPSSGDEGDVIPKLPPHVEKVHRRVGARHDKEPQALSATWYLWTTTGSSAATQPSIGNGSLRARIRSLDPSYARIAVELTFGSTTNPGAGGSYWSFDLDGILGETISGDTMAAVAIDRTGNDQMLGGTAWCDDDGTWRVAMPGTGQAVILVAPLTLGTFLTLSQGAGPTVPFTWNTGDRLIFSGVVSRGLRG